jgi:hypothetical protein
MAQAIAPHFIPTKILVPLISAHHPMPRCVELAPNCAASTPQS